MLHNVYLAFSGGISHNIIYRGEDTVQVSRIRYKEFLYVIIPCIYRVVILFSHCCCVLEIVQVNAIKFSIFYYVLLITL